ncbi:unnamed protein product [Fraxinus pennsylvanica]|uniref:Inositol-tetrakisphosphate 1-kinase n=1 Tax=Fraxinus pennsylvanica TaxID=56036 RepID=A0AAD1ZQA9_9LAMI|nr:unnamed protein product [Fraxinus pennsylvanica]
MGGDVTYNEVDEEEKVRNEEEKMVVQKKYKAVVGGGFPPPTKVVVVGYALTSKKIKSFLQPKLEGKEWRHVLEDYGQNHPEVTVLDPPDAIQQVHNRQSMLQDVADMNLSNAYGKVGVPKQLIFKKDPSSIPDAVNKAGLRFPIVAKPLFAKSHELSLAYDEFSLQNLELPLVLQEFINHGGVMFKVYIVGEAIKVVRRFSLPDVSKRELSKNAGVYRFPRVSCAAASADEADLDPCVGELPPRPLLEKMAKELRRRLGLRLFNLDIIREHGTRDSYYVIDINYFPGYGKMPEYEHVFTDFLLSLDELKLTPATLNSM